jgi:MFS family permease
MLSKFFSAFIRILPLNRFFHKEDLLRNFIYRRLWISILISSFGAQITLLALPLTAAVLLHATPMQMGFLTFMEVFPYFIFSLPSGVLLDRLKKLPVYISGQVLIALSVSSVPLLWWLGYLNMTCLYVVGFLIGLIHTMAGTAGQIVLAQIVPRERLIEAHARNALATSGSEVVGPAAAGALIKIFGAPITLLVDAFLLLMSASILKGIHINENIKEVPNARFLNDLKVGLQFVTKNRILIALAFTVGGWQLSYYSALVVQILFATRTLGLSEHAVGLSYMCMGLGAIIASIYGNMISSRLGPGKCIVVGISICGFGWGLLAIAPANQWGVAAFAVMLTCFAIGGVLIFINFLALRQAVTPDPLLGRMTSTMRWLILIPAGPGSLIGGWLGEHLGLRYSLGFASLSALLFAFLAWKNPIIQSITCIKKISNEHA